MSRSLDLGPPAESAGKMFLKSQFLASAELPPKDTDVQGKVAIVTGSSSGLGLEASLQLLSLGLSGLVMAVRSTEKGEKVAAKFRAKFPKATIQVWPLEMESYESVQSFVRRVETDLPRLDIAILNAALQCASFERIPGTGHEKEIQVNYLSTALLAILLLPSLKAKSPTGQPGRLTIVSSGTARGAVIREPIGAPLLPALDDESRPWNPIERYAVSKLLGHLFLPELVRYVRADDVVVNLVDPGLTRGTNLQGFAPAPVAAFFFVFKGVLGRNVHAGASTYVDAAVIKGKESHGCVVADWNIASFSAFLYTPEGTAARAQLWKETIAEFEFAGAQAILDGLNK